MIGGEGDKKQIYIYIIVFTSQAGSFVEQFFFFYSIQNGFS